MTGTRRMLTLSLKKSERRKGRKGYQLVQERYPEYFTLTRMAAELGTSRRWLREYGKLPNPDFTYGKAKLWHRDTVREWFNKTVLPGYGKGVGNIGLWARKDAGELRPSGKEDFRLDGASWWRRWNERFGTNLTRADAERLSSLAIEGKAEKDGDS